MVADSQGLGDWRGSSDRQWTLPTPQGPLILRTPASLMGIINCTPDSFSDGGKFFAPQAAIAQALTCLQAGAQWLDIGGESTRPGSQPVDVAEEWRRVEPVITAVRKQAPQALLSIDTQKAAIAERAIVAGVDLVNDVSAGRDPEMLPLLSRHPQVGYCLMHMRGVPATMQQGAISYDQQVCTAVADFLCARQAACEAAGIARNRLLVDPGIGFGKATEHNIALLHGLSYIEQRCQAPILLGLSRKRFLPALVNQDLDVKQRDLLSHILHAQLQWHCALLRIHDVAGAQLACTMYRRYCDSEAKEIE